MDISRVLEFLSHVPLMTKLPPFSLEKIAEVVRVVSYEKGDYVISEGEIGEGIYLIWDGKAEISDTVNNGDDAHTKFCLKRYDYFGIDTIPSICYMNVIALDMLICLLLPSEYCSLLLSNATCDAENTPNTCLIESILSLEPIEVNIYRGITLPDAPQYDKVFGGQFVGQAMAAASRTVDCLKVVNCLHAYFLLAGDVHVPIMYEVHRLHDGKNFATRRVDAIQIGRIIFTLLASFQNGKKGFEHQAAKMPSVPVPETLLPVQDLQERRLADLRFSRNMAAREFLTWPIEIRFCQPRSTTIQEKLPPSLNYWFRAREKLSDEQGLHRCVAAYASDLIFIQVSLNQHHSPGTKASALSLNHSMWFHRSFRADDWLLFVITSPIAHDGRGFVTGEMFNRQGELVASLAQEGKLSKVSTPAVLSRL